MGRMHNDRVPARFCMLEAWHHAGVGTLLSPLYAASMLTGEYDTPAGAWRSAQKHLHGISGKQQHCRYVPPDGVSSLHQTTRPANRRDEDAL